MILFASLKTPKNEEDEDTYDHKTETAMAHQTLAQLMDFESMQTIIEIFAQKILQNLVFADGQTDDGRRIIKFVLETFDSFVSTSSSCRLFIKLDIVKQLISNHMA